jgi:phytoene/squalene synthetase
MRDLAPALILLPLAERYRLQALIAYCLTLFDFVRQTGLEGERFAEINRWEFHLEAALDGTPPGQPVFVLLADIETREPWTREGFDRLHATARRRCAVARPTDQAALEKEAVDLAAAVTTAFLGGGSSELVELVAAVLRAGSLVNLGEDLRRHRARLPVSELPDVWESELVAPPQHLDSLVQSECSRLAPALTSDAGVTTAPSNLRRAIEYVRLASLNLVQQVDRLGAAVITAPPQLNLTARLLLLARARWLGR